MNSGSTLTLMSIDSAELRARRSLLGLLAELPQGTKLPGERLLAEDFGVCRMTMRRAIEDLLLDGRLERHARSGTYVRRPIISSEMRLKSFTEELKSRGMVPSTEVISLKKIKANKEIAKHLGITVDEVAEALESNSAYSTISLDITSDTSTTIRDTFGALDEALEGVEYRESLKPLLAQLEDREKRILQMRFFENLSQSQIATELGISQMHVSRILNKVLSHLREGLISN